MRPRYLDTSELEPPEPMQAVLAELATLAEDEYLVMAHRKEPTPLYVILRTKYFCYHGRPGSRTPFELVIWREDGPTPDEVPQP